jgi:uncharacterized protein (TIGR03118 family)
MTISAPFRPFGSLVASGVAIGALCAATLSSAAADPFTQTNLVSDLSGLAKIMDPALVNPWGVSFIGPTPFSSPFWISNQGSNNTTLYAVTDTTDVSKVNINGAGFVGIPTTATGPQGPTGQVSNTNGSSFDVGNGGNGNSAAFIFANLNGAISAWNGGTSAFVQWTTPGASYTGLAKNQAQTMLFAADDAGGAIDVFNSSFTPVNLGAGAFATPAAVVSLGQKIGVDFVPFNVEDLAGNVFVTYAPIGHAAQTSATAGEGAVAEFSESGVLENTIAGSQLASPWGMAIAPKGFGKFGGDLLVGNFSYADSEINAFNLKTDSLVGTIDINVGASTPGGLWDLTFGGGGVSGKNGNPLALYFTDGINGEKDGLFGVISVPEPSTWAMMLAGFASLGFAGYHASRKSAAVTA